ncbi:MAG: hypothetical protein IJN78_04105 [Clostridia bacterium]|nr:hypothetical protein [Clostridia bacterium]
MTIEQIGKLVATVRSDLKKLYDMHLLSVSTDGKQGLRCFNPEALEAKMNRTDEEILNDLIADGAIIDGIEAYLASLSE